ncbi:PEP-CTERM sorting domain-containing protein [Algisphaera agarilytica]|uniref:Ice-binding protein C-terminal domain-containing protein n=1 Tax=Algisphaera agarilytica TaxID=1385975 RepID=A0A7X0H4F6_9BACT|nr:PEP-CTERM sorting domain-containing protein [Algisphaera agarilytica]MBB6429113.1 hypothetical protein [Algisphaera agarilytica]
MSFCAKFDSKRWFGSLRVAAVCGLMGLSATAVAQEFVLYDFEGTDVNTFGPNGAPQPYSGVIGTTGATSGTQALAVTRDVGDSFFGFLFGITDAGSRAALLESFDNGGSLLFDISSAPGSFTDINFFQFNVVLNIDGNFSQIPGNEAALQNLGYFGPDGTGVDLTSTIEVPLSAFPGVTSGSLGSSPFAEIILSHNHEGSGSSTIYFDNIRLTNVPEPGSLALMGLGGVALLCRSKRRGGR